MAFAGIPGTYVHVSTGATLVTYASVNLGYAEDRIQIDERPVWEDIKNDAFGGMAGVPSDAQYLGSIAYVTCTLNRFVESAVKELSTIDLTDISLADGTVPPIGRFMRQDTMYSTLVLTNANSILTYSQAFLRQGRRFNVGVRHQQIMLMFECHINNPCDMVLFTINETGTSPCS
jgi:hypothetical protein